MLPKKLEEELNLQINYELFSGYYYLSMAQYFETENLDGFAHFFYKQELEEREHAFKMMKFINERGGTVILQAIKESKRDFNSPEEVFKLAYEHEQFVTKRINGLMDLALKENDHASVSFLRWFVDEQVEEENSMDSIHEKLKLIGGNTNGIFMMDSKLAQR